MPAASWLYGGSYGGFMTLEVATNYADRIRCAIDIVGISNLATFLKNTESYRRDLRRVEYGDERDPKMAEFMEQIAALNNAQENHQTALCRGQGANDPRVPKSEAEQIVATLKKQETPVWYMLGKDEGHGFGKKKNADYSVLRHGAVHQGLFAEVRSRQGCALSPHKVGSHIWALRA